MVCPFSFFCFLSVCFRVKAEGNYYMDVWKYKSDCWNNCIFFVWIEMIFCDRQLTKVIACGLCVHFRSTIKRFTYIARWSWARWSGRRCSRSNWWILISKMLQWRCVLIRMLEEQQLEGKLNRITREKHNRREVVRMRMRNSWLINARLTGVSSKRRLLSLRSTRMWVRRKVSTWIAVMPSGCIIPKRIPHFRLSEKSVVPLDIRLPQFTSR